MHPRQRNTGRRNGLILSGNKYNSRVLEVGCLLRNSPGIGRVWCWASVSVVGAVEVVTQESSVNR